MRHSPQNQRECLHLLSISDSRRLNHAIGPAVLVRGRTGPASAWGLKLKRLVTIKWNWLGTVTLGSRTVNVCDDKADFARLAHSFSRSRAAREPERRSAPLVLR
jgi:hypothetical protein